LVLAGVGVEHDHAPIAVAVGNKHLVGLRIYGNAGRPAQMLGVVAVGGHAAVADLQQKLSVLGEFQDLPVAIAVAGQPDVVLVINSDAMLAAAGTSIAIAPPLGRAGLALHVCRKQSAAIEPIVLALRRAAPALEVT